MMHFVFLGQASILHISLSSTSRLAVKYLQITILYLFTYSVYNWKVKKNYSSIKEEINDYQTYFSKSPQYLRKISASHVSARCEELSRR